MLPSWKKQEALIKEKRTLEANQKNLMGSGGKLAIIASILGDAIMNQGSVLEEENPFIYQWETYDKEPMPTASEQDIYLPFENRIYELEDGISLFHEGFFFNGLNRGINLEIIFKKNYPEITVTYNGVRVYHEQEGELECYVPHPSWENIIDRLFEEAKEIVKNKNAQAEKEKYRKREIIKKAMEEKIRKKWGL